MLLLKKKKAAAPVKKTGTTKRKTTQAGTEFDFDFDNPDDPADNLTRRKR